MHPQPVLFHIDWNACIKCGACIAVCPQEAGFTTAFDTIAVNTPCDIACMACEHICPVSTISHETIVDVHQLNVNSLAHHPA